MADAEAITEAAARPTMRFVAVKSAEKQASGMVFKTRDLLVRQRTQTINALRGHPTEHGIIAPQGVFNLRRVAAEVENVNSHLPSIVIALCTLLLQHIATLDRQIAALDRRVRDRAREDETARRLMRFDPTRMVYILPLADRERLANSADLLSSPAMKNLLSQLTAVFATVIVDLPALSRTVDACAVAPMLDQCVLVTKWGGTPLEPLKEAVDLLRADQICLVGAIINQAEDGIPPPFGWRLADLRALDQTGYVDRVIHGVSR